MSFIPLKSTSCLTGGVEGRARRKATTYFPFICTTLLFKKQAHLWKAYACDNASFFPEVCQKRLPPYLISNHLPVLKMWWCITKCILDRKMKNWIVASFSATGTLPQSNSLGTINPRLMAHRLFLPLWDCNKYYAVPVTSLPLYNRAREFTIWLMIHLFFKDSHRQQILLLAAIAATGFFVVRRNPVGTRSSLLLSCLR